MLKLIDTSVCFMEWVMQCLCFQWDGSVLGSISNRGQSYIGSATTLSMHFLQCYSIL